VSPGRELRLGNLAKVVDISCFKLATEKVFAVFPRYILHEQEASLASIVARTLCSILQYRSDRL
jgi:hypothetical protein